MTHCPEDMMENPSLTTAILNAWQTVCSNIADGHANEFTGPGKETSVFRLLQGKIERALPGLTPIGPDGQEKFQEWYIDLVCFRENERIAVEGKFKIISDGAVPDNRKAAFFDLFKLEQYVSSGKYSTGLFLWLTNDPGYLRVAKGDSSDFSTHQGRVYEPNTKLDAKRSRDPKMPLPLTLGRRYVFNWQEILPGAPWQSLVLEVL